MKTIAIDFDGVIHAYSKGWHDGSIYDEPVTGIFDFIQKLFDNGYSVYIFSTRKPAQIKKWLQFHIMMSEYEVDGMGCDPSYYKYTKYGYTCEKIPFWKKFWNKSYVIGISRRKLPATVYIDDRSIKFDPSELNSLFEAVEQFKTWQETGA